MEAQDGSISLDRAGSLIVEFAPVAPGSGTNVGNRSYQWDKKQVRDFHALTARISSAIPGPVAVPGMLWPGEFLRIRHCLFLTAPKYRQSVFVTSQAN